MKVLKHKFRVDPRLKFPSLPKILYYKIFRMYFCLYIPYIFLRNSVNSYSVFLKILLKILLKNIIKEIYA